jgi:hypothetical protein
MSEKTNKDYLQEWEQYKDKSQYGEIFMSVSDDMDAQFMMLMPSTQYKLVKQMCVDIEKAFNIPTEESFKLWLKAQRCPGCNNKMACTCSKTKH